MSDGPSGGILLLDKPQGISSFQALRPVKRLFPKTRIGHAGTLDPAASGLLLVGVGAGTRLLEYLEGMPKTYSFLARFGLVSDSYDMEGAVEPHPAAALADGLDPGRIENALEAFRGRIRQTPPVYSAIKIGGERACDRVRAGETVTLQSREVRVHSLRLLSFHRTSGNASQNAAENASGDASPEVAAGATGSAEGGSTASASLEMTCSKGTYVRSLVHDLGQALGCGAVTDRIRRLAIGSFRIEDAVSPDSLAAGATLLPLECAVPHLPEATIPAALVARFLNGQAIASSAFGASGPAILPDAPHEPREPGDPVAGRPEQEYRAVDPDGRLLAIATLSAQGLLCPRKVLVKA